MEMMAFTTTMRRIILLRLWDQLKDPMILVLLGAAALSLWSSGGEDWLDSAIILLIVVVNAIPTARPAVMMVEPMTIVARSARGSACASAPLCSGWDFWKGGTFSPCS